MTSQQILMNKTGIVLASDSAVTIDNSRSYPSVNKIFSLGKSHQVSIMISGAAEHRPSGVSWERIISLFGKTLLKPNERLVDYYLEFQSFIQEFETDENTPDINSICIIADLVKHFTREIYPAAEKEELSRSGPLGRYLLEGEATEFLNAGIDMRVKQLLDEIDSMLQWKKEQGHLEQFTDSLNQCKNHFDTIIQDASNKFCTRHQCEHLVEEMKLLFLHKLYGTMDFSWRPSSEIVIAGFGEKDLTPSVMCFKMSTNLNHMYDITEWEGSYGIPSLWKIRSPKDENDFGYIEEETQLGDRWTTYSSYGTNISFAQHDAASTFMTGMSEKMLNSVIKSFMYEAEKNIFPSVFDELMKLDLNEDSKAMIAKEFEVNIAPRGTNGLGRILSEILHDYRNIRKMTYERFIQGMPIEELCKMAYKLIDFEVTNSEYTKMIQSVGGDIKIVYITKENGVSWKV